MYVIINIGLNRRVVHVLCAHSNGKRNIHFSVSEFIPECIHPCMLPHILRQLLDPIDIDGVLKPRNNTVTIGESTPENSFTTLRSLIDLYNSFPPEHHDKIYIYYTGLELAVYGVRDQPVPYSGFFRVDEALLAISNQNFKPMQRGSTLPRPQGLHQSELQGYFFQKAIENGKDEPTPGRDANMENINFRDEKYKTKECISIENEGITNQTTDELDIFIPLLTEIS